MVRGTLGEGRWGRQCVGGFGIPHPVCPPPGDPAYGCWPWVCRVVLFGSYGAQPIPDFPLGLNVKYYYYFFLNDFD